MNPKYVYVLFSMGLLPSVCRYVLVKRTDKGFRVMDCGAERLIYTSSVAKFYDTAEEAMAAFEAVRANRIARTEQELEELKQGKFAVRDVSPDSWSHDRGIVLE